jgi:Tfp pilus assembly protein PilF
MTTTRLAALALTMGACLAVAAGTSGCRRTPDVPPEVYREAVVAFHTALAAIDTSQEVLAREKLDRVVALVPQEPAGWANLGLLLLRQQENVAARERLAKAAELAPDSAAVVRLQALVESREGNLAESARLWRRALELDPSDPKAAYALAQETERQGGADADAEAQRVLAQLLARADSLPVRLDYARLAAKRGDASGLAQALGPLAAAAVSWPVAARERLTAVQSAATTNPRAAATQVAFLRNLLAREPAYRRALALVTTPLDAVGEPIARFLVLPAPSATPAAPDTALRFSVEVVHNEPGTWAGTVTLDPDGPDDLVVATSTPGAGGRGGQVLVNGHPSWAVPLPAGWAARDDAMSVVTADLNYDYRPDLVVVGKQGIAFNALGTEGATLDRTAATKLDATTLRTPTRAGWPADVDLDGDLDLVIAPIDAAAYVLRNNGDGSFARQQPFGPCANLHGFAWADFDGEGVPDAACLDEAGTVRMFVNLRGGAFEPARMPSAPAPLLAVTAADVTGDGRPDLVGVASSGAIIALTLEDPSGGPAQLPPPAWRWREVARLPEAPHGATTANTRVLLADLDNNAALDIIVSATDTQVLLGGAPNGFVALPSPIALRTLAIDDLRSTNGDPAVRGREEGRLDLIGLAPDGRAAVARSTGTKTYHWQRVKPRAATATGDQRINSFGIGGEVEVRSGLHVQTYPITSPVVHIGLGEATSSDVIRLVWPNGVMQSEFSQKSDTTVRADQRLKGSCPWLFAWNGREMAFVTDLIWRSPLGLRINAQVTADASTTEDWVKVGGSHLVARDGAYDLRITTELWETHFFDLVSLAVVDHPVGTEVFLDERFAIPAPALTPVVTGPLQAFARVTDDAGRDQSAVVATRDDQHLDFAGRGAYQGITRQHAIELVVPDDAPRSGPLYLVAQGWVHPTDSSINVAIAQGTQAKPNGLALEVADADGRFRVVKSGLGFPSGKDKTVLIPLHDVLPATGARRVRLTTNLEIFWDRLAWAVGRPDVHVTPTRLPLRAADLRYRGFSVTTKSPTGPERPRYVLEGTAPRWLDLEGFHTRFGDVQPLLASVDDRYVIMNAGDEMALRFTEPPPVAPGLVRDFIVVGDGWVKDGDYNTTFSRTVLPLPTHATGRYDSAPRTLDDDPIYRQHADDFATYHTRYVTPLARRALRTGVPPLSQ